MNGVAYIVGKLLWEIFGKRHVRLFTKVEKLLINLSVVFIAVMAVYIVVRYLFGFHLGLR